MQNILQQVGLCWPTLFFSSDKTTDVKSIKKDFLKRLIQPGQDIRHDPASLVSAMTNGEYDATNELLATACERVALKFCLKDTDFASDVLSSEEYENAQKTFDRNQCNAKVLQKLLGYFGCLIQYSTQDQEECRLRLLFAIPVRDELQKVYAEKVDRDYKPLRKVIDKAVSGVKAECYLEANQGFYEYVNQLDDESNQYILDTYGYDCNQSINSFNGDKSVSFLWNLGPDALTLNPILQSLLLDDASFWENNPYFSVVGFIRSAAAHNDPAHARKLWDFIFRKLQADPFASALIRHQLPLLYYAHRDQILPIMEKQTIRWAFERFRHEPQFEQLKEPYCYPLSHVENVKEKLTCGKRVFESFLKEYVYPHDSTRVLAYFRDSLQEHHQCDYTLAAMLDKYTFGYVPKDMDVQTIQILCPDYFTDEQIMNRVYLKVFAMDKAYPESQVYPHLFELFFPAFEVIGDELHISTALQMNLESREETYRSLGKLLENWGITCSENHKQDYIISLLDRKVALLHEAERFPVLEQFGDAVYGLAVAELMFYRPESDESTFAKDYEMYISAPSQIRIAEHIGLHHLYIAASSLSRKYDDDTIHFQYSQYPEQYDFSDDNDKKYMADSLEMVIGTICLDHGIAASLHFTKELLQAVFPDRFAGEIRYSPENLERNDIEPDYWSRILPAPYSEFSDHPSLNVMQYALNKALGALVIGTDTREKRRFITFPFNVLNLSEEKYQPYIVGRVLDCYLRLGLESTIDEFQDTILEKYRASLKK